MRTRRKWSGCRTAAVLLAASLLAAGATALQAADGRDFAGCYQTTNEVESGENILLTFEAEIFNYSGADIVNATVSLEDPLRMHALYASWSAVQIDSNASVRLSSDVSVPIDEQQAWRDGAVPLVIVEWQTVDGLTWRRPVELRRDLLLPEGAQ